jgi:GNAT superfamily N-acetyltransferase
VTIEIHRLGVDDLHRVVAAIDRTEVIDIQYEVVDGVLRERSVAPIDVPPWTLEGAEHSVDSYVAWLAPLVAAGAPALVPHDDDVPVGLAVVVPDYDLPLGWLAFLHVSRSHRRRGVAAALWDAATDACREAGATSMYVSATPSGSAVGFYRSRGCVLADPPRPELFEPEPHDIHLVLDLSV